MRTKLTSAVCAVLLLTSACQGMTLGENDAGKSTYMDDGYFSGDRHTATGSIAVNARTEVSYVLQKYRPNVDRDVQPADGIKKRLLAVDPDTANVDVVTDLSGRDDVRMIFPQDRMLLMSQPADGDGPKQDRLSLIDPRTHRILRNRTVDAWYNGTRLSPSGRILVAGDNNKHDIPIHFIDTRTLGNAVIDHGGDWAEAMWTNKSDSLIGVIERGPADDKSVELDLWDLDHFSLDRDAHKRWWKHPVLQAKLEHFRHDMLFSFTWITVSPHDHYASIPLRRVEPDGAESYALAIWNLDDGSVRTIADARGPAAFTPDGSNLVAYEKRPGHDDASLLVIDPTTGDYDSYDIPGIVGPQFFVTHDGNRVVVASTLTGHGLVLYDLDNLQATEVSDAQPQHTTRGLRLADVRSTRYVDISDKLARDQLAPQRRQVGEPAFEVDDSPIRSVPNSNISLDEFVSRTSHGELWLVDRHQLYRLDYMHGSFQQVELAARPLHINRLPRRDLLVLDDASRAQLLFYSPGDRRVVMRAHLPGESGW